MPRRDIRANRYAANDELSERIRLACTEPLIGWYAFGSDKLEMAIFSEFGGPGRNRTDVPTSSIAVPNRSVTGARL